MCKTLAQWWRWNAWSESGTCFSRINSGISITQTITHHTQHPCLHLCSQRGSDTQQMPGGSLGRVPEKGSDTDVTCTDTDERVRVNAPGVAAAILWSWVKVQETGAIHPSSIYLPTYPPIIYFSSTKYSKDCYKTDLHLSSHSVPGRPFCWNPALCAVGMCIIICLTFVD